MSEIIDVRDHRIAATDNTGYALLGLCQKARGHLRQVCLAFHMVPTSNAVYFPKVQEIFDEKGELKGKSQQGQAQRLLAELIWYAQVLKAAREKEPEEETAEGS